MAELQTLARPYARAAFSVARDQQALAEWGQALQRLAVAAGDDNMAALIGHPDVAADDLVGTFGTSLAPAEMLDTFVGEEAMGTWTLQVGDQASPDEGTLNSWGISYDCM